MKQKVFTKTPAQLGYAFPPEWYPHEATWLSWPRPEGVSFPRRYHAILPTLARIVHEIAAREPVHINVPNENCERIAREQLEQNGCALDGITFHHIRTNECWCRDHGPAFVIKQPEFADRKMPIAIVDWGFNAWGGKYPPWDDDDAVPTRIAEKLKLPLFYPWLSKAASGAHGQRRPMVMEGGAVDFNGAGTVMTTSSCLLNKNRNPKLKKKQVEQYLKDYYGQQHVVWLGKGIAGDDTDGHIDDLARFIGPRTIVTAIEEDPDDVNYRVLQRNLSLLRTMLDQEGHPFEILELPMPAPVEREGHRLPATYLNFYFINGALLVPTFDDPDNDERALATLQLMLPNHKVIGIDCTELIWGLGAIHCLTQQQPRV